MYPFHGLLKSGLESSWGKVLFAFLERNLDLSYRLSTTLHNYFRETGRDLFRMSKLVKTMCTCPSYLKPLRSFRKRIAYANAYRTDFVVPTSTALFLNHESTYPHHVKGIESEDDGDFQNKSEMVIATLQTPQDNSDSRFGEKPEIKSRKRWPTLSRMVRLLIFVFLFVRAL